MNVNTPKVLQNLHAAESNVRHFFVCDLEAVLQLTNLQPYT